MEWLPRGRVPRKMESYDDQRDITLPSPTVDNISLQISLAHPDKKGLIDWVDYYFSMLEVKSFSKKTKLTETEIAKIHILIIGITLPHQPIKFKHYGLVDLSTYEKVINFLQKIYDIANFQS